MNVKFLILSISAAAISVGNLFSSGWEIKAAMQSPQTGETNVTVLLQDDNLRADLPGTSMLMNLQTGDVTTVMHEQKMFMQLPTAGMAEIAGLSGPGEQGGTTELGSNNDAVDAVTFQPTGRKETISGFPCEEYTIPSGPDVSIWFTKESPMQEGFVDRLAGLAGVRKSIPFGFGDVSVLPGFPVRVNSTRPGEEFEITILSVREKSFVSTDFTPPAGYQPFTLPPEFGDMLKQLRQQASP